MRKNCRYMMMLMARRLRVSAGFGAWVGRTLVQVSPARNHRKLSCAQNLVRKEGSDRSDHTATALSDRASSPRRPTFAMRSFLNAFSLCALRLFTDIGVDTLTVDNRFLFLFFSDAYSAFRTYLFQHIRKEVFEIR